MIGSLRTRATFLLVAGALTVPILPAQGEAQGGSRFRVLVANLTPTDGTRANFGEDLSDRLRDILDLSTHVAMAERDTDQAARQYDMRLSNLDCTLSRQLADILSVPLVFCGTYQTVDGQIEYTGSFFTVPAGEEFSTQPARVAERDARNAAQEVLAFFEATVDQLNQISYCGLDFNSSNWQGALEYCTRAVELAPEATGARVALARTYMELERWEESLAQFDILLTADPYSSPSLEAAGFVALQSGDAERAFDYYSRFLELNPNNIQVRMRLAYDLAQGGDFEGAMELLRAGIEQAPEDIDLHEAYGTYVIRHAIERQSMAPPSAPGTTPTVSPEVAELFRTAFRSLERVFEARGAETAVGHIHNLIRARIQLGEVRDAIAFGRRAQELFAQDAQIQALMADAHARDGQYAEAVERMRRALQLQPDYPNANARMAQWALDSGDVDAAVTAVMAAAAAGEQTPDQLASMLFGHGWNRGVQAGNREMGIRLIVASKQVPGISAVTLSQANFFHGYALFQPADATFREDTSPAAAQRYLPVLREARGYLTQGQAYAQQSGQNLAAILEATDIWIETAEAVIARSAGE